MHDYRTLVEKADLALSDITTDGGILVEAQAARFIRLAIKQAKVMPMATTVTMRSYKQLIEKIRFNGRVLRAGAVNTALAAADRSKANTSKTELDAKLFKGEVRLHDEILEDNLERSALRSTIMNELLKAIPRDMDEVIIQGDTSSADPFLAQFDGLVVSTTSNALDCNDAELDRGVLKSLFKKLPVEFRGDRRGMRFLTGPDSELNYRDTLGDRVGQERYVLDDTPARWGGIPVESVDLIPEDLGTGGDQTVVLLTDMRNINVGIWRQVRIETDRDVSAGSAIIVVTLRFDVKYSEETAAAIASEVKVSA